MSYPYDNPSLSMSTVWQSGNYTPNDVVRVIRDNYTPVNKNSMRNSVGQEISLLQNYVNSKFLGREDIPINTGYISNLINNSGEIYIYNSGLDYDNSTPVDAVDSVSITPQHISINHYPQDVLRSSVEFKSSGIYVYGSNGVSEVRSREMSIYPEQIYSYGSGPTAVEDNYGVSVWYTSLIPYSGLRLQNQRADNSDITWTNYSPSGITWNYVNAIGTITGFIGFDTTYTSGNNLIINCGRIYSPSIYANSITVTGVGGFSTINHSLSINSTLSLNGPIYNSSGFYGSSFICNSGKLTSILGPYANNAAALAAGLVSGDIYHDNGDPRRLCIAY